MSLPSEAYDNFKSAALAQLAEYTYSRSFKAFDQPIKVDYIFYRKGKLKQDVDNAIASINDVLQDAKIIADDELIHRGTFERYSNCDDWKTVVQIDTV